MDMNVRAFKVVQAALSEGDENTEESNKSKSGRKGGLVGGPSRARSISPERRREIAQKASNARWRRSQTK